MFVFLLKLVFDKNLTNNWVKLGVFMKWVRSQLAALDMLHRIKEIFGADHVPVVSSGHSGFLHHQKGPIPPCPGLARHRRCRALPGESSPNFTGKPVTKMLEKKIQVWKL
jgi:hypothetical protein